ncbi:MAG: type II CRISPR RNA-guided endonuclease Cas9 [Malacoplasma sp.]|nr:type II CRISPR RNA-guided endonuclease Cas9 [Malacoplasma sp.]
MNNEKKKLVNIGFDIGITSVGWAIVDEDNKIIDRGVRLFEELKNPKDGKLKNQERRTKRQARRMISRRKNRKDDFIKLVTKKYFDIFKIHKAESFELTKSNFLKIINDESLIPAKFKDSKIPVLYLIEKGLNSEIKPVLLLKILYYYLSHRGYSYMSFEQYKSKNENLEKFSNDATLRNFVNEYEAFLKKENVKNFKSLSEDKQKEIETKVQELDHKKFGFKQAKFFINAAEKFIKEREYYHKSPSEIQKMEFEKYKYLRGNTKNNDFSKFDWEQEIKKLLSNQKYLSSTNFEKDYLEGIFKRVRDFSEGPGSEKSPSNYGLWRKDKNGKVVKEKQNLWDYTIGKCSVFIEEDRANKKSSSAEVSNLLNQLNTIDISDNKRVSSKLEKDEKKQIIFEALKGKNILKTICSICKADEKCVSKYPTKESKKSAKNANENANFEKLENSKILFNFLSEFKPIKSYDDFIDNYLKLFNDIIDVFAKYPTQFEEIETNLEKLNLDKNIIKQIIESNKINSKSTSGLSYKAHNLYIEEEIASKGKTLNQKFKKLIDENENKKFKFDINKSDFSKYINVDCLDDQNFILSPTTKCSFREALKVFNKILKLYIYKGKYCLNNIVVEMPTEWNTVDKRKKETEFQRYNESLKEQVKSNYGYEENNKTIIQKLVLLNQQNNKDIYTNESIDPNMVIKDPNYVEIDHIIPFSISYDNSINNRVLVLRTTNQEKRQRTPYEYLQSKGKNWYLIKKNWEDLFLTPGDNYNKKKFENLTYESSSEDSRRAYGFIGRNLADTRYACRIFKQALTSWLSIEKINNLLVNNQNEEINVITINGKQSQIFRREKYLNIEKDRDDFRHHAIDATICAIYGNSKTEIGNLVWFSNSEINYETGEITSKSKSKFIRAKTSNNDAIKWNELSDSVKEFPVKFSYKINKKSNIGFWGDTLVSIELKDDENLEWTKFNLLEPLKFVKKENKNIFEVLNDQYKNGDNYSDPKLWKDLVLAYEWGKKISESNEEYKNKNPFELYMQEFCKTENLGDYTKYNSVILKRKSNDGNDFYYSVKSLKYNTRINSFNLSKKGIYDNSKKIGAFTNLDWKEIRLFKDSKGKYRVIPMQITLYSDIKKNKINKVEYDKKKQEYDIDISKDKFFIIHKGSLIVNKNDNKDIRKVVGIDKNKLDIKEIYKPSGQNQVSISTILDQFYFCNVDELGNVSIIKDLGLD